MREVIRNGHYEHDIKSIMRFNYILLSALGVWPKFDGKRSICEKIGKFLRIFISYIILYCALIPGMLFLIIEKRARTRLRVSPIMFYGLITLGKYYNLIIRESQIRCCLNHVKEDWKGVGSTNARNVMLKFAKTGRRLTTICAVFLYSSGLSLRTLMPLSKGKIITPQNTTIRPLPYPTYLFSLDVQFTPVYEMVYALHCLSGLVTISISVGVYGLIIMFTSHACGQLRVLIDLIVSLVDKRQRDELEVNKKLAIIVNHQTRVRSFLQLVECTVHQICFVEITGSTLIICILCYCILMEWENSNSIAICSYFISLSSMIINMFMFCYTGEQLIAQGEKVAITSCELEWYRLPFRKARGIVLVMIISNMPIKISAGKLIDLSLKTFGDILKTSAAYLNVLRSVTN